MKVAAVQHDVVWEDRDATLARVRPQVEAAAAAGARLVVLTELFATGFSMAVDRIAEPPDGPTTAFLVEAASRLGVWVAGSVPVLDGGGTRPRNRLVLAGPGGERHRYDKRHPFTYGGEDRHYAAGEELPTFTIEGVRVSPAVCYDLRFADGFWCRAADTDLYVVVASWPAARRHHWRSLLVARAIENQAYVMGVNRVGEGGGIEHAGDSCVVDPLGEVLAAAAGTETALVVDVDPEVVRATRARFPFLDDRRPPQG